MILAEKTLALHPLGSFNDRECKLRRPHVRSISVQVSIREVSSFIPSCMFVPWCQLTFMELSRTGLMPFLYDHI